jgi:hypothetical protein
MHYNTGLSGASPWLPRVMSISLDEFLKGKNNVEKINCPSFSVTKESLPKRQKIIIPKLPV